MAEKRPMSDDVLREILEIVWQFPSDKDTVIAFRDGLFLATEDDTVTPETFSLCWESLREWIWGGGPHPSESLSRIESADLDDWYEQGFESDAEKVAVAKGNAAYRYVRTALASSPQERKSTGLRAKLSGIGGGLAVLGGLYLLAKRRRR